MLSVAATLGSLVGAFVLPDRGTEVGGNPAPTTSSPPASRSVPVRPSASPSPGVPGGVSDQLLQSDDLAAIQVPLDRLTVDLNLDNDFSSCLGEGNSWTQVLPGSPKPIQGSWTSRRDKNKGLSQLIAQAKTPAEAKRYAETLIKFEIRNCQQGKSPWDFHYGPPRSSKVGSGSATWALSYTGESTRADGGVVVFRKGTNFGIVQVTGTWGPADQLMESVAKAATSKLFPRGK